MLTRLRLLLIALVVPLFVVAQDAEAQVIVELGTGTSVSGTTQPGPHNIYFRNTHMQFIYTKDQLEAGGISGTAEMKKLGFWCQAGYPAGYTAPNYRVRMKHTAAANVAAHDAVGLTQYYYEAVHNPTPGDWNMMTLSEAFRWNGEDNILIDICWDLALPGWTAAGTHRYFNPSPVSSFRYTWSDVTLLCNVNTGGIYNNNLPHVRMEFQPIGIEQSYPDDVDPRRILRSGYVYGTSPDRPSVTFRQSDGQELEIQYKIVGPLPSQNVIYTALQNGSETFDITASYTGVNTLEFTEASGIAAGPNGELDLSEIPGGAYRVIANYWTESSGNRPYSKDFLIAYERDMSVREIVAPNDNAAPRNYKYPLNVPINVAGKFQNVGLATAMDYEVSAEISFGGTVVYEEKDTVFNSQLQTGEELNHIFSTFTGANQVGEYNVKICTKLLSVRNESGQEIPASDQQVANDCLGMNGSYSFEIAYELEVAAASITRPANGSTICGGRPIAPEGVFTNGGISDLSDIPTRLQVYRLVGGTREMPAVYDNLQIMQNLPSGEVPIAQYFNLINISQPGEYEAVLSVAYPPNVDPIPSNDQTSSFFTIQGQLDGVYEVGLTGNQDFLTIQDAVDALYTCGVSGPVQFVLTDNSYTIGGPTSDYALDLRSAIVGASSENTITWVPSQAKAANRGSITINMESVSGIGVYTGQSLLPTNLNAVILEFPNEYQYANASGYMTWDGGENTSFRFRMKSNSPQRAAFYFGRGSHHYEVMNSIIENDPTSTPSYATSLPQQKFNQASFQFTDEADVRTDGPDVFTYSAAVVARNTVPVNRLGNNSENLDTTRQSGINVVGNEISGFGYGIVSLGMGTLLNPSNGNFENYYNTGNSFSHNMIKNVARAGIFVGFERETEITGNRIWNVGDAVGFSGAAAGVMAGGAGTLFNNENLHIDGNEVSGVASETMASGIVINQSPNVYIGPDASVTTYPSTAVGNNVVNNVVWGLERESNGAGLAGIHLLTRRDADASNPMLTPDMPGFNTNGDFIANNTVVMTDDEVSGDNVVVAFGLQQATNARMFNNAFAVTAPASATSSLQTALFYQGVDPRMEEGLTSDRNAFFVPNGSVAYMIETTEDNVILDMGANDMFVNLQQWKALTNQDNSSVMGDFVAEHEFVGAAPMNLRVKSNPTPLASILNNRGLILSTVMYDVDGNERGQAEQRYDIGANEFNGRIYLTDLESVEILSPRSYRRTSGMFSEAEYIMGEEIVSVKALIRNAGSISQQGSDVTATVLLNGNQVAQQTVKVFVDPGQTDELTFDFNGTFEPQTYRELGQAAPQQFAAMDGNVTPVYTIRVTTVSDQNMVNNLSEKQTRFYLYKAESDIMVSASLANVENPEGTEIAGQLNFDAVVEGLSLIRNMNYEDLSYNVLDRANWEPYSIDYSGQQMVIFSADQFALPRHTRTDLRKYLNSGDINAGKKANLLIAGQDIARNHQGEGVIIDQAFVNQVLRAELLTPSTPVAPDYQEKLVQGVAVGSAQMIEELENTNYLDDSNPVPSVFSFYSDNTSSTVVDTAYRFLSRDPGVASDIMGVAQRGNTSDAYYNVIFYGVDWRHFGIYDKDAASGVWRPIAAAIDYFNDHAGGILGVDLVAFDAYKVAPSSVEVAWETVSEENSARFDVERKATNETEFVKVGEVAAAGNSSDRIEYSFTDKQATASDVYTYRLRSVDFDGSFTLSSEVTVDMRDVVASELWVGTVKPNPVRESATVAFGVNETQTVRVELFDLAGEKVATLFNGTVQAGEHQFTVEASNLSSGRYMFVVNGNGVQKSGTVTIVK